MDLNDLPALKAKELRELRARIDFLLKGAPAPNGNGGTPGGEEDPALLTLGVVHGLCRDRGLESRPLDRLVKSQNYLAFAEKVPEVLASLGADKLSHVQLRFVLKLAFGLTLDALRDQGVPVWASVLMNQVHRLPGVLDAHFPGYRQAGLLKLIARTESD